MDEMSPEQMQDLLFKARPLRSCKITIQTPAFFRPGGGMEERGDDWSCYSVDIGVPQLIGFGIIEESFLYTLVWFAQLSLGQVLPERFSTRWARFSA